MSRILYFIIIVAFLDTFIQLPIITPYAQELGASLALTGGIVAVYSLTNMVGNIVGGHWIDRYGRKRMLLTGMIAVTIILLFYPYAQTGEQLFIILFFHGLAARIVMPAAFAYVADVSSKASRGKTMAYTRACIGISAIIGPAAGGIMAAKSSIEYVFIFVAILFVIAIVFIVKYIEETFVSTERGKFNFKDFIPLLKHPLIIQASLAAFALMVSNGTLAFALPLKTETMGLAADSTGLLLSTFGIVALIVFLTPLNRIYDRFRPLALVIIGIALVAVSLIVLSYTTSFISSFLAMIVYGFGFALIFPTMNSIVTEASSKVDRGKAYGIFYAFFSLGAVAGSSISGTVAQTFGEPFIVSAVIMLASSAFLLFFTKKRQ